MTKTIFEEMGGTYTHVGDYLLPDLKLPCDTFLTEKVRRKAH